MENIRVAHSPERATADLGAYALGYMEAIKDYAVWRNGQQVIGSPEEPVSKIFLEVQEAHKKLIDETLCQAK